MADTASVPTARTPVVVFTGFLGSGKTTVLNQVLAQNADYGRRLAVIENEFGAISIDTDLIIGADEDIVEMKNGCMCCTVRRDLINILSDLVDKGRPYDVILIETTGLANPSPIAQTFMAVEKLWTNYELQGFVTVVDALHIEADLERHPVTQDQVAFANLLVLNKADLVTAAELDRLEGRLHTMNSETEILRTNHGQIDSERVFRLSGFDVAKGLRADPIL
jgi:G3E family GTPase